MSEIVGTISENQTATGNICTVYGKDGLSAYQIALKNGFIGTEKEWLESLHGQPGYTPVRGVDYWTKDDIDEIKSYIDKTASGSIVNEASGSVITLKDSSNRELQGLTLSNIDNRNLFNKSAGRFEFTQNGVTYGAYIDVGNSVWKYAADTSYSFVVPCLPNTDYTLSGISNASIVRIATMAEYDEPTVEHTVPVTLLHSSGGVSSATVTTNQEANYIVVQVSSAVVNTVQLEVGSIATEYSPYVGSVTVKVMGKNLLNVLDTSVSGAAIKVLEQTDDYVIVQSTAGSGSTDWSSGWYRYNYTSKIPFQKGVTYTISVYYTFLEDPKRPATMANVTQIPRPLIDASKMVENTNKVEWNRPAVGKRTRVRSFYTATEDTNGYIFIPIMSGTVKIEFPMIEIGDTLTDYEPYKGEQTLVVSVPDGLGADGFVCEDFAQLHTYKPNTTITNDVGAIMSVEYVADTKAYIDNKFTELQNAILASGANV